MAEVPPEEKQREGSWQGCPESAHRPPHGLEQWRPALSTTSGQPPLPHCPLSPVLLHLPRAPKPPQQMCSLLQVLMMCSSLSCPLLARLRPLCSSATPLPLMPAPALCFLSSSSLLLPQLDSHRPHAYADLCLPAVSPRLKHRLCRELDSCARVHAWPHYQASSCTGLETRRAIERPWPQQRPDTDRHRTTQTCCDGT